MDKFLIGYKKKSNNNKNTDVGTSSGNISNKEQEEELPRKENMTNPIYRLDSQVLLTIRWKNQCICFAQKFWLLIV